MTLVDADVFMYAAGAPHRCKEPSLELLGGIARGETEATTDAEVLQEILHRYRAIDRGSDGRRVFDLVRRIIPAVLPVTGEVLDHARHLMDRYEGLVARDAVHAAVVRTNGLRAICSYDRDFDIIEGLHRVEPP